MLSPKTVANHVEHIYTKRASELFAMHHGLLPEEEFVPASASVATVDA